MCEHAKVWQDKILSSISNTFPLEKEAIRFWKQWIFEWQSGFEHHLLPPFCEGREFRNIRSDEKVLGTWISEQRLFPVGRQSQVLSVFGIKFLMPLTVLKPQTKMSRTLAWLYEMNRKLKYIGVEVWLLHVYLTYFSQIQQSIYFRVMNLTMAQLFVWLREWLSCARKWLSRNAIACLFMFKNVNEHGYHYENVCLFAHLTVRLVLMIWMFTQLKVCFLPMNDHRR